MHVMLSLPTEDYSDTALFASLSAGWNKFCFTGGVVEVQAQLPGRHNTGGLWPAMWLMGNLARATFVGSSENTWPWSYDKCDRQRQKGQVHYCLFRDLQLMADDLTPLSRTPHCTPTHCSFSAHAIA